MIYLKIYFRTKSNLQNIDPHPDIQLLLPNEYSSSASSSVTNTREKINIAQQVQLKETQQSLLKPQSTRLQQNYRK